MLNKEQIDELKEHYDDCWVITICPEFDGDNRAATYVCTGGYDLHDHNETLQFKDCFKVLDDLTLDEKKVDVYFVNPNPEKEPTDKFFGDELLEIIVQ